MKLDKSKLDTNYVQFFEKEYNKPIEELAEDIYELLKSYNITEETINIIVNDLECWFALLREDGKQTLDYFQKSPGYGDSGKESALIVYLLAD